ncbi:MAG: UvrD-helicase domain-containing protein, partial [Anaerolineaceae bacterium]
MEDLLDLLNPQQQQAVAAPNGPTLILAGPGSGKTRVLTYRIAYLVGVMHVPPYHILAVTFTNKAAREMAARVEKILGSAAQGMWLGTFHAICGRILRREADLLPVDQNFVIFDADDQATLMKDVIRESNLDEKFFRPESILDAISRAKNDLISPENYPIQNFHDEQVKKCYARYQQLLVRNNAMDFDDMLVYTNTIFEQYPLVCDTYSHKFEHILVDEFQDTNLSQYAILRNLAAKHRNLYVVGDEDQSIYRWRGADYRNIKRFQTDFKDSHTILLEQNYRSTQTILDGAMAVIDCNANRTRKKLFTEQKKGDKITLFVAGDDREEAQFVVDAIQRGIRTNKINPNAFAVMYRTNAQSRLLEEAFRREGISYRLVGAQRFYGRREVKDVIAFFRLIHNLKDEISLRRVINLPPRGIGEKTLEKLAQAAQTSRLTLGEALLHLTEPEGAGLLETLGKEGLRLAQFGSRVSSWRKIVETASLAELFDRVLADVGYQEYIQDRSDEGQDRWENVMELRQVILEYEGQGLGSFLEAMALVADQDTLPETLDAPTMLT